MHFFKKWLILLIMAMISAQLPAWAAGDGFSAEGPLTQADIDAYIFVTSRLVGAGTVDRDQTLNILQQVGLSSRRAAFITAKIAITQAVVSGALSPDDLAEKKVPIYLQPSHDDLILVRNNLNSLMHAQASAR